MSEFVITGFSDEISADFNIQLEEISKLGIAYIEIRGVDGKNISEHSMDEIVAIKSKLDAKKIGVSAIGSPIGKIKITEDFEAHFDKFKHTLAIAKQLNTQYMRIFSFFIEEGSAAIHRDEVIRRLKIMVEYAEQENIILLHENEKDIYGDIPERCLDLYTTIQSEHFKLIFDPANFVQCGVEVFPKAFDRLKEQVIYYHIKDAVMATGEVVPSGQGDGGIASIIAELKSRNYQGFLSLEPHLGNFVGFSELEDSGNVLEQKDISDASKFALAFSSLMTIIQNGENHG
jgi:sugar phosphate isomerase/epimerase